jgi:hypothetical protein
MCAVSKVPYRYSGVKLIQGYYNYKSWLLNFYNSLKFVFIYAFSATIPYQMQGLDFWNVLSHANIRH